MFSSLDVYCCLLSTLSAVSSLLIWISLYQSNLIRRILAPQVLEKPKMGIQHSYSCWRSDWFTFHALHGHLHVHSTSFHPSLNPILTTTSIRSERKRMESRMEDRGRLLDVERERKVSRLAIRESRHLISERQDTCRLYKELHSGIVSWGKMMMGCRAEVKRERGGRFEKDWQWFIVFSLRFPSANIIASGGEGNLFCLFVSKLKSGSQFTTILASIMTVPSRGSGFTTHW